jgi:hypothetical protein
MTEEKLAGFLQTGKDWGRLKTTVRGVFVLKLPAYRSSPPRLAVELNPVDEEGAPMKRRGLILRSRSELESFRGILQDERLSALLGAMDAVNPGSMAGKRQTGDDVLEL